MAPADCVTAGEASEKTQADDKRTLCKLRQCANPTDLDSSQNFVNVSRLRECEVWRLTLVTAAAYRLPQLHGGTRKRGGCAALLMHDAAHERTA
eukprot:6195711-Pleurochrysis_carterae.AAC.3